MKMRRKCRVWWPKQLSLCRPSSSTALFGWFVSCSSASLDVVVAHAADEVLLSKNESGLQGILHCTNENMPVFLQETSAFTTLGHCAADFSCNGQLSSIEMDKDDQRKSNIHGHINLQNYQDGFGENYGRWSCGCQKLGELLEQCRQASIGNSNWMQFIYDSHEYFGSEIHWIPRLHHIHWNGQIVFDCDVHVVVYETPRFGVHHFLLCFGSSSEQVKNPLMKPKWVNELHQKQSLLDLDAVILAINSSNAAKIFFDRNVRPKRSSVQFPIVCMFSALIWNLLAISVASFSTLFYIILQLLSRFASYGSESWICIILAKAFCNTWKNIQIRCCQILYWPIFLRGDYHRGRKWNPLRRRLDSYDYTVEQHIVGSLLFTPLLLLLPTTSVFYIFFTILNTTICLLCILVEITISIIHATPYSKIFLWLMSPRRFPSGTWLEIISSQSNAIDSPEIGCLNEIGSPSTGTQQRKDSSERRSGVLVSFLRSNLLNIGQILLPHYKNMFSGVCGSFITSSARGLLTGRRMPSTLGTGLPAPMPWMSIPYKEYWRLCRDSVIACMQNPEHHLIQ